MTEGYEAVVVGSGIVGVCLAIKLAELGFKTLIIDRCSKPCGATTYSGGVFTRILDDEDEYSWALKSHRFYRRYLNKAGFISWGYLILEERSLVEMDYEDYVEDIQRLKIIYPDDIPDLMGMDIKLDDEMGLLVEDDFTVNPALLVEYLRNLYLDMGGEFLQAYYRGYDHFDKRVLLDHGEISFEKLFICLGPWGEDIPGRYRSSRLISIPIYKFDVKINLGFWDETLYGYFRVEDDSMVGGFYDAYPVGDVNQGFGVPHEDSVNYALDRISIRLGYKPRITEMWRAPVALSFNFKPFHMKVDEDIYILNGFGGRGIILGPGYIEENIEYMLESK